jgi:hypothetical protein
LFSCKITDEEIDQADALLWEYCLELIDVSLTPFAGQLISLLIDSQQLYGPDVIKPNHHFSTHIAPYTRDFLFVNFGHFFLNESTRC